MKVIFINSTGEILFEKDSEAVPPKGAEVHIDHSIYFVERQAWFYDENGDRVRVLLGSS